LAVNIVSLPSGNMHEHQMVHAPKRIIDQIGLVRRATYLGRCALKLSFA
jgi:hypothetical protein